jgi:hypothetical protein
MTKEEHEVAAKGREMVRALRADWQEVVKEFGSQRPFDLAVATALLWSRHAVTAKHFYPAALRFLKTGQLAQQRKAVACFGRFGPEPLNNALVSWRTLSHASAKLPSPESLPNLINLYTKLLQIAIPLHQRGGLPGVGAWLFCGPFKVLLCSNARWVRDRREREIPQPLGIEVMRGVRKARRWGWFPNVTAAMLDQEEGDLVEGMGNVLLIHGDTVPVADSLDVAVVELNSGLWWLGAPKKTDDV